MTTFSSPLATALGEFLAFKRRRGYQYGRAEFTLRSFDRFVAARAHSDPAWRLDEVILAWLASRPGRLGVTVAQDMAVVRQFWHYARRRHPARCRRDVRWPKLPTETVFTPHVLTVADVRALLRQVRGLDGPRFRRRLYRALLLVLYCTGLRVGEALRLRMSDVDLERGVLFIAEFKGRARWVPFHRTLGRELRAYLVARRAFTGAEARQDAPWFVGTDGGALSAKKAGHTLRCMFRLGGLKPPTGRAGPRPYDLRHTFAVHRLTRWYREGADLHARLPWLSAYMGHADLLGTETYLTATPELLGLAAHRLHRRFVRAGRP